MSEIDTLRWGDVQSISGLQKMVAETSIVLKTKQMISARWRWPLVWVLRVAFVPQFAADESGTFTITVTVQLGTGGGLLEFPFFYTLAPQPDGSYRAITDAQLIPAQDCQVFVSVTSSTATGTSLDTLLVGAWMAPETEPHAMTRMHDMLAAASTAPPHREARWMREGFQDDPLNYGPHK
jgi:hypothetical protein